MSKDKWIMEAIKGSSLGTKFTAIKRFLMDRSKIDELTKCALCPNMCRFACPINIVHARETTSPAGKSRIAFLLKKNLIELNLDNAYPLFYCIGCDSCSVPCPYDFSVNDLIKPIRSELLRHGIFPGSLDGVLSNLREKKCLYDDISVGEIDNGGELSADILFYPGCIMLRYYSSKLNEIRDLFNKLGYTSIIFNKPIDCGYLAYEIGLDDLFESIAYELTRELSKYKVRYIITPCPECAYMFKIIYPRYKMKIKPEVLHLAEFVNEKTDILRSKTEFRAVIHDSATLAIKMDKPNILKDALAKLGVEVIYPVRYGKYTFETVKENSMLFWVDKQLAEEINKERAKELLEFSDTIIVPSYGAKRSLEKFSDRVYDLSELLIRIYVRGELG